MTELEKYKYIIFRVLPEQKLYFITATVQGKILSIYCLSDNCYSRGIFGTPYYVNYVVDVSKFFDSVLTALSWGYEDITQDSKNINQT